MKIETKFDIGQDVYYIDWSDISDDFIVRTGKITGIYLNKVRCILYKVNDKLHFGSYLFVTEEDAEALLKEMQYE